MRSFLLGLLLLGSAAHAEEATPPTPPDVVHGERYDGRTVESWPKKAALAVPRAILAIPRFIVLGVGAAAKPALEYNERHHVVERLLAAITSEDGKEGVRPVINYETAFRPSVGALYFNDRIRQGGRLVVSLAVGGPDTIMSDAHAIVPVVHERFDLDLAVHYKRRDDELYTGIGMLRPASYSRYGVDQVDGTATAIIRPVRALHIDAGLDFGLRRFNTGSAYGDDPSVAVTDCVRAGDGTCQDQVDEARIPGFANGTQFAREILEIHVDSRRDDTSAGLMVDGGVEYTHGLGSDRSSYVRLRGHVGTAFEIWRHRALYIGVTANDLINVGTTPIPFSELVMLGGPDDLRGFARGRFRDASSMLATIEWRWPVWMWMDGSLFFDYGGVFGPGFSGFSVGALRPDVGVGFRVHTANKMVMRIQAAWGFGDLGGFRLVIAGNGNPS